MAEKTTALAKVSSFELAEFTEDFKEVIAEEMEGLGTIPFDRVKIPSGGMQAFEVPSAESDEPDIVKEITGVVVMHHGYNAFWERDMASGESAAPDCMALDGKTGIRKADGKCIDCSTCALNQFGSGKDGNGKACKNAHQLYIVQEGKPLPIILTLPPTSIKPWKNYLAKRILLAGKRPYEVITTIGLSKEQNAQGTAYSMATFKLAGTLSAEDAAKAKAMSEGFKGMLAPNPTDAVTNRIGKMFGGNDEEAPGDDDLPF